MASLSGKCGASWRENFKFLSSRNHWFCKFDKELKIKYELNQKVTISVIGESGEVTGRAEYSHADTAYLVRYKSADGNAVESWWMESDLVE